MRRSPMGHIKQNKNVYFREPVQWLRVVALVENQGFGPTSDLVAHNHL